MINNVYTENSKNMKFIDPLYYSPTLRRRIIKSKSNLIFGIHLSHWYPI